MSFSFCSSLLAQIFYHENMLCLEAYIYVHNNCLSQGGIKYKEKLSGSEKKTGSWELLVEKERLEPLIVEGKEGGGGDRDLYWGRS